MGGEKHNAEKIQSEGRKDNAAQPLNDAPDNAGPERYPATNRDDSITAFEETKNPQPRQGAGDDGPDAGKAGTSRSGEPPAADKR